MTASFQKHCYFAFINERFRLVGKYRRKEAYIRKKLAKNMLP